MLMTQGRTWLPQTTLIEDVEAADLRDVDVLRKVKLKRRPAKGLLFVGSTRRPKSDHCVETGRSSCLLHSGAAEGLC